MTLDHVQSSDAESYSTQISTELDSVSDYPISSVAMSLNTPSDEDADDDDSDDTVDTASISFSDLSISASDMDFITTLEGGKVTLTFRGQNQCDETLIRELYEPLFEWVDPDLCAHAYEIDTTPNQNYFTPEDDEKSRFIEIPSLALVLFLVEEGLMGNEKVRTAQEHFSHQPWKFHHSEVISTGKIKSSPDNNQDYFLAAEGYPLCSIRQLHCGKPILRFVRFIATETWQDNKNFYCLVLGQDPDIVRPDFCLFTTGSCEDYDIQLALKKVPIGIDIKLTSHVTLCFRVNKIGHLVPLLPNMCVCSSESRWETVDLDGNKIYFDVIKEEERKRLSASLLTKLNKFEKVTRSNSSGSGSCDRSDYSSMGSSYLSTNHEREEVRHRSRHRSTPKQNHSQPRNRVPSDQHRAHNSSPKHPHTPPRTNHHTSSHAHRTIAEPTNNKFTHSTPKNSRSSSKSKTPDLSSRNLNGINDIINHSHRSAFQPVVSKRSLTKSPKLAVNPSPTSQQQNHPHLSVSHHSRSASMLHSPTNTSSAGSDHSHNEDLKRANKRRQSDDHKTGSRGRETETISRSSKSERHSTASRDMWKIHGDGVKTRHTRADSHSDTSCSSPRLSNPSSPRMRDDEFNQNRHHTSHLSVSTGRISHSQESSLSHVQSPTNVNSPRSTPSSVRSVVSPENWQNTSQSCICDVTDEGEVTDVTQSEMTDNEYNWDHFDEYAEEYDDDPDASIFSDHEGHTEVNVDGPLLHTIHEEVSERLSISPDPDYSSSTSHHLELHLQCSSTSGISSDVESPRSTRSSTVISPHSPVKRTDIMPNGESTHTLRSPRSAFRTPVNCSESNTPQTVDQKRQFFERKAVFENVPHIAWRDQQDASLGFFV